MNRICKSCGHEGPASTDFYKKTATLYRSDCKECHKKVMRPRSKAHYQGNKKSYRARNRVRVRRNADFIRGLKTGRICKDCRLPHPYWRLDFDHLTDKVVDISRMALRGWTIERMMTEIAKCELVCANCHRDRTYTRLLDKEIR